MLIAVAPCAAYLPWVPLARRSAAHLGAPRRGVGEYPVPPADAPLVAMLLQHRAAGHRDHRTQDVAAVVRREGDVGRGKLSRLAGTLQERVFAEMFDFVGRHRRWGRRRPDRSRRDAIDAYAFLGEQLRETGGEIVDRPFVVAYARSCGEGILLLIDAVLTIALPGFMCGIAAFDK